MNILGINYDIEYVDKVDNNPNCAGLIVYEDTKIYIKNGLSKERKKQVLMHEIVHALLYETDLHKQNDNEDFVNRLATTLNHFIQNNEVNKLC